MSKARPFSIYLLKDGFDATSALESGHTLLSTVQAGNLPTNASLYVLDNTPVEPWWRGYFGITKSLAQVHKGALIFLPTGNRCFALAFGHVAHHLKDTAYEYDFGLRVTLNCLDPKKLKSTDVLDPGASRRQRTQMPNESDLTYFDFDRDTSIIKSLTGKVRDEYKDLFRYATGSSNLKISSDSQAQGLAAICDKLLTLYDSSDYKTLFPGIQNIQPVKDPNIITQLEGKLLAAFQAKSDTLSLIVPDLINYQENISCYFTGAGPSLRYDDVYMGRYYEYLAARQIALNKVAVSDLKKHHMELADENGAVKNSFNLFKCMLFDTDLGANNEIYHLCEGSWYRVEQTYADKLKNYLDPKCEDLPLPAYNHATEGAYNLAVQNGDSAYICLDKKSIAPNGQSAVEPCDLYTVVENQAHLYHIKVSTLSSELSHLFNQGTNSADLIRLEDESRNALKGLVKQFLNGNDETAYVDPISNDKTKVIFGMVTHKNKTQKSLNLPLFSRISLKRSMEHLTLMGIPAVFGFIADQSVAAAGKVKPKKKRKKKAANTLAPAADGATVGAPNANQP